MCVSSQLLCKHWRLRLEDYKFKKRRKERGREREGGKERERKEREE
jgi:hypothetical protein